MILRLKEQTSYSHERQLEAIIPLIEKPNDRRLWAVFAAIRRDVPLEEIYRLSRIDMWFLRKFWNIVQLERQLTARTTWPNSAAAGQTARF